MLNDAGIMIKKWYEALVTRLEGLVCDDFVCMPNHVHFIIFLNQQFQKKAGRHIGLPLPKPHYMMLCIGLKP